MDDIISSLPKAEEPVVDYQMEAQEQPQKQPFPAGKDKLGVALVGLGSYSEHQLAPALRQTAYCRLTGIVSGNGEKREKWRRQYTLDEKNLYSYDNFDEIAGNHEIDIVYVALPNALHAEYVIRAARSGKHIICEKPMATALDDCHKMIQACREAGVRFSMGYRLHFDPFNQEMMRLGQNQVLGSIDRVIAKHCMDVGSRDQWRLNHHLAGGGPLMDLGVYCIQGALYTIGELPVAVTAKFLPKTDDEIFQDVEEAIEWQMEFPMGVTAICETSYSRNVNLLRAETVTGWFELQPAYLYSGLKGHTSEGPMNVTAVNQQAAQIDDFALCIQNDTPTRVPPEMGLRDMEIIAAIYESARTGRRVELQLNEFRNLIEI